MKFGPFCPILGEDFSFPEELAALSGGFPRPSLRDHANGRLGRGYLADSLRSAERLRHLSRVSLNNTMSIAPTVDDHFLIG
jgi:hypothetical protein